MEAGSDQLNAIVTGSVVGDARPPRYVLSQDQLPKGESDFGVVAARIDGNQEKGSPFERLDTAEIYVLNDSTGKEEKNDIFHMYWVPDWSSSNHLVITKEHIIRDFGGKIQDMLQYYFQSYNDGGTLQPIKEADPEPTPEPSENKTSAFPKLSFAHSVAQTTTNIRNILSSRMHDIKGNSDDPFVQVFGSYDDNDKVNGIGSRSKTWGILGGVDFVKDLKSGSQVRYGGVLSYSHSNIKFTGDLDGEKSNHQGLFVCWWVRSI